MIKPFSQGLQFVQLHLVRPLDADAVLALLGRPPPNGPPAQMALGNWL